MSMTAHIFPGQGSQYVGMGKDLYDQSATARAMFQRADELLGFRLSAICFEGPEEELRQTRNTQPAIFLHSTILSSLIDSRDVAMVAGHSLGEYSALVVAGAVTFDDGLSLVRLRGELMQRAGEEQKGTMAAVIGLEPTIVEEICSEACMVGVVQCANFNSPGQIVVSGSIAGVHKAMELSKSRGAKLVKELVVSGAFHSPLMQSARDGLKAALANVRFTNARIPVYANVSAQKVQKAEEIRTLLEHQLTSPVRWEESIQNMILQGVASFVEVGPGKVLQGLVKRINGASEVRGIDKYADIERAIVV